MFFAPTVIGNYIITLSFTIGRRVLVTPLKIKEGNMSRYKTDYDRKEKIAEGLMAAGALSLVVLKLSFQIIVIISCIKYLWGG